MNEIHFRRSETQFHTKNRLAQSFSFWQNSVSYWRKFFTAFFFCCRGGHSERDPPFWSKLQVTFFMAFRMALSSLSLCLRSTSSLFSLRTQEADTSSGVFSVSVSSSVLPSKPPSVMTNFFLFLKENSTFNGWTLNLKVH